MVFSYIFFVLRYLRIKHRKRLKGATFVVMMALLRHAGCAADANVTTLSESSPLVLPATIRMDCCDMLDTLNRYTVKASADSLDALECRTNKLKCTQMQIIQRFVRYSRLTLGSAQSVSLDDTGVVVMESALQQRASHVLLLAFLGHAVQTEIGFDGDSLTVINSVCSQDKTIYSTIVVASIALLIFFVASQIVEKEQRDRTTAPTVITTKAAVASVPANVMNPILLRMRMH